MPTVSDFCDVLHEIAPSALAESWDNVGLLIGRSDVKVAKAMTCLTLTPEVAEEAVRQGVQLIISHHPVLFRGTKQLSDRTSEGRMLLLLIENNVAVFSAHTAFDSAVTGINEKLARDFGLKHIQPMKPSAENDVAGTGRFGRFDKPVKLAAFLSKVAAATNTDRLEHTGAADAMIRIVGIGCGAAEGFLSDAAKFGCDTFVTGEARFHTALEARSLGITMILTGHYPSERPAMEQLAMHLAKKFRGVEVFASVRDMNPLQLYIRV